MKSRPINNETVYSTGVERVSNILLLVGLFIGVDALGFGLKPDALSIGTPIGDVNIVHLYTLSLVAFSLVVGNYKILHRPNGLSLPLMGLFLLFLIAVTMSFGRSLFTHTFTSKDLVQNVLELHSYLFFIPLVLLIRSKRQFRGFVKGVFVMSGLAALIVLYQSAVGVGLPAARMVITGGLTRFLLPTSALMVGGFCTLVALYFTVGLKRCFVPAYLLGLLLLSAILVPLHRGTMLSLLVVLFGIVLLAPGRRLVRGVKVGVSSLVLASISGYILTLAGVNVHIIPARVLSGIYDAWHGIGTAGFRLRLLQNTWEYVLHNYPLFGRGFDWVPHPDFATYLQTAFVQAPTHDSGFASILIMFGLFGVIVFGFIFYRVFKCGISLMHSLPDLKLRALVIGIMALNAHTILVAISEDSFSGQPATTVLVTSWALLYLMLSFQRKEQIGER